MKQPNPKFAHISNDELLEEMVGRQHSLMTRMQAAIGLYQEEAAPKTAPAPKAKAKTNTPAAKAPAAKPARAKASAKASAPPAAKRPATNKSINDKPVHHYVLEAVRAAGGPVKPSRLVEKMVKLGWKTSSDKPYSIAYMNLQILAKKGMVVQKNKLWVLGPNANHAPERSKPGRKARAVAPAPAAPPSAENNIDNPAAVLGIEESPSVPPPPVAAARGISPAPEAAPPALREGESIVQSPNGTNVIRRAGRAETEAETA